MTKPLGPPGGFGAVFLGADAAGKPVAVKRLHINAEQAAHRELTVAQDLANRRLNHVMPVLDAGQDAESDGYFVVMPVAERSLQEHVKANSPFGEREAAEILENIADGLAETPHLVHRDLKPANVLRYEGRWRIADFGIARFVEDSTSSRTLKECLSPHFAAPEQWRQERATSATDIYALGCIAVTLLKSVPPFNGTMEELREAHLHATPPALSGASPQMQTLVSMMLRKTAAARPSIARVKLALQQIKQSRADAKSDDSFDRLAAAAAAHEREQSLADAEREKRNAAVQNRQAVAVEARNILKGIFEELARRVDALVPNAKINRNASSPMIQVGPAALTLELIRAGQMILEDAFPRSKWDVVCGAAIAVKQSSPPHQRAASLWYTRQANRAGDFRWYEVGYESNPLTGRAFPFEPVAVEPELADRAHSNAMDVIQTAYQPVPIDDEHIDGFCRRWAHILAEACVGRLQALPRSLPSEN